MKLINSVKNETIEISALGAISGRRCDSVELNEQDLSDLLKLSPIHLHDRLTQIRVRVAQVESMNKDVRDKYGNTKKSNEAIMEFLNDPETIAFSEYCNGGPVPKGEEYLEEMAERAQSKLSDLD